MQIDQEAMVSDHKSILGMNVDVISPADATARIENWAKQNKGRYVCVSNVHMCMEAFDDKSYQQMVNEADMVVADGRPIVWAQSLLGARDAQQVRGMDLMLGTCERAAQTGIPVGLYGGKEKSLMQLSKRLQNRFPGLKIACAIAPPFRPLTEEEDQEYIQQINESGARILFVSLGCPKQERWMAAHRTQLDCVMLGVGAAFAFIEGRKLHAPRWVQLCGLEWLLRMLIEPRRLWKRYLKHNPRFVLYFAYQLVVHRKTEMISALRRK